MAAVQPKFGYPGLRISYTCGAAVTGGQLVELTDDRIVGPAGAASNRVAGVALWDVPATRATIQGPQVGDGNELSVATDCVVELTASGAIAQGDRLIAAAAGAVSAAGATPDARQVVGFALADIANGAKGLCRVNV